MENKDFIIEEEVLITDVAIGYEDVPYKVICYDGYAKGTLIDTFNEYPDAPKEITLTYPTLNEILCDKAIAMSVLRYRGLWDKSIDDINYGDIMMYGSEISL
jgi:hypothetical protein